VRSPVAIAGIVMAIFGFKYWLCQQKVLTRFFDVVSSRFMAGDHLVHLYAWGSCDVGHQLKSFGFIMAAGCLA